MSSTLLKRYSFHLPIIMALGQTLLSTAQTQEIPSTPPSPP